MKLKKMFLILIGVVIISTLFTNVNVANAANDTLHVGLSKVIPETSNGYAILDPTVSSGNGKTIWNLISYKSATGTDYYDFATTNMYCLKAGAGFYNAGGQSDQAVRKDYTSLCDLREKDKMINSTHTYVKELANSDNYYKVLYLVDNLYIKGKSTSKDIEALLRKSGIYSSEYINENKDVFHVNSDLDEGKYYYISDGEYDYSSYVYYGSLTEDGYSHILTEEDIVAVQQLALWHFTNNGTDYDKYSQNNIDWLEYTKDNANTYKAMGRGSYGSAENDRAEQAVILYHYLIDSAEKNAANYKNDTNTIGKPISTKSASTLKAQLIGDRYVAGPIKLDKDNDLVNEIKLDITDNNGNDVTDYSFVDSTGKTLNEQTISELIGKEFYISLPKTLINKINIKFNVKYETKKATIYVDNTTNIDQPIVVPEIENQEYDMPFVVIIEGKFDLALRKYITKVDGIELKSTSTRIPNIDTENTLDKGKETADYKHKKDPVQIKTGSIVTYNISVYNEGDKDGYATEVTDQLPTGLKSNLKTGDVVTSTKGNTYVVTYDEKTNKVIFKLDKTKTVKGLSSYVTGKLDKDTIEIECTVSLQATSKQQILTNVAWISEEYNKIDDLIITNQTKADRDSEPATVPNVTADSLLTEEQGYKGNDANKDDLTDSEYFYKGKQDDDDFEKLILLPKTFDLKLVKYITAINGDKSKGRTITSVDSSKLKSGEETTAEYTVSKDPLLVRHGNYVTYTFRIYNEGDLDGYASEITEDIPYGLQFVWSNDIVTNADGKLNFDKAKDLSEEDKKAIEFNSNYYWTFKDSDINKDGKIEFVESTYLSKETETTENGNLLKAFDSANDDGKGSGLSYKEISIMLKVTAPDTYDKIIRNEAEISKSTYSDGKEEAKDRDSDTKKWVKYEDDEDYDNIKLQYFDLALRKFITDISGKTVTSRIPQVEYKDGKITYKHPKTPLEVVVGDTVTYTIRVYNEGKLDGYASKVTDDIPEYLEYLPDDKTNKEYRWVMIDKDGKETTDVSKAVKVTTDYLSKEQEEATGRKNLLKAFDSNAKISETNPDYKNLKIAFKVKDPKSSDYIITNHAQISDDTDEDGNPIDDIDSIPDEWNDGEDDQDVEHVKVQYFDLALRKWVTQAIVIENGKETVTNTGHKAEDDPEEIVKVDLDRKKLSNVVVKFVYKIRVTNEGDIAGYAKEITDYVPSGLKFVAEDNKGWTDEGNNVISTRLLENTLLQPGESATVEVTLTWINGKDNMGVKVNTAEISEDYNDKGVPDRDSTPNNKVPGEDDIDDAPVMISIKLGEYTIDTIYFVLGGAVLITLAGGIVLIKKFVL